MEVEVIEFQSRPRTHSQSQRTGCYRRPGIKDTQSRAVSHTDIAGTGFRTLKHQFAGADSGCSRVTARARKCERAGTEFAQRATAAAQSGGKRNALPARIDVIRLVGRRIETRGV